MRGLPVTLSQPSRSVSPHSPYPPVFGNRRG